MFETLLPPKRAAEMMGVHPGTLLRWAREGRIPSHRLSDRKILFRASELDKWLRDRQMGDLFEEKK